MPYLSLFDPLAGQKHGGKASPLDSGSAEDSTSLVSVVFCADPGSRLTRQQGPGLVTRGLALRPKLGLGILPNFVGSRKKVPGEYIFRG